MLTTGIAKDNTIDATLAFEWNGKWVVPALSIELEETWYLLDSSSRSWSPIVALNEASRAGQVDAIQATDSGLYWYQPTARELQV